MGAWGRTGHDEKDGLCFRQFLKEGDKLKKKKTTSPPYPTPGWATTPVYPASSCTSASWPAGEGRPWCYAGNATRTFTPDAGTEQRPKKAVTGKPDDIERVTSGLAGGRRERSRKTTSPAAYPTTSARTSSETVGGDDELHRASRLKVV